MTVTVIDQDGLYVVTQGETVSVTHDSGSGSELPVAKLDYTGIGGMFTVDASNGALAIINSLSDNTTALLNANGGTIAISSVGNSDILSASIANNGSLIEGVGLSAGDTFATDFTGTGQLELQPGLNIGTTLDISDFHLGDAVLIDLFSNWDNYSVTTTPAGSGTTDDTVWFTKFGLPAGSITLNGVPVGETITASHENWVNTLIQCVCFLPGTRIATAGGEREVENLREGDLVRTFSGAIARVTWVGHRTIDTRALHSPQLAMPVRITAGAIADCVPARDLVVTPEHALLVEGHLIPARLLVNHSTIRLEQRASYTFYHVELERHDVLLAEGMGAESYLDTGNRRLFANNDVVDLFAGQAEAGDYDALSCMKLTVDPAATGALWQAIANRAALLGRPAWLPATTDDAELAVFAGKLRLRPVFADHSRATFALPPGTVSVTVRSRASMPWSLRPWLDDRRRLGVAIDRIVLRTGDDAREIALDSPALGEGWWAAEPGRGRPFRWTAGAAQLALPAIQTPAMLELTLVGAALHEAAVAPDVAVAMAG